MPIMAIDLFCVFFIYVFVQYCGFLTMIVTPQHPYFSIWFQSQHPFFDGDDWGMGSPWHCFKNIKPRRSIGGTLQTCKMGPSVSDWIRSVTLAMISCLEKNETHELNLQLLGKTRYGRWFIIVNWIIIRYFSHIIPVYPSIIP